MKLIEEIVEILSSDAGSLTDALIKTKVLLHTLGHKELVPWVNSELNGYPDDDTLPEYRVLPATVLVNASNPGWRATRQHIPLGHLSDEQREAITTARMDQSLAVLERYASGDGDTSLQAHIPMESYGLLGQNLGNGYQIESAWSEVQKDGVLQILVQVRSRLLDFMLELRDQFPNDLDDAEVKERIDSVDTGDLFRSAIFGDNTTILVGSGNTQTVTNFNAKGDFDALARTLRENGVSDADVEALAVAVAEDEGHVDDEARQFGPKVKLWLQGMLAKAVEATWQIELGVASSLLATALNHFYGWF